MGDAVSDPAKVAPPECVQALIRCKDFSVLPANKCEAHCLKEMTKAAEQAICTAQVIGAFCAGTLERPLDLQGLGYIFWANVSFAGGNDTDGVGQFTITGVREGNYSLWARLPGCVPEQQLILPKTENLDNGMPNAKF